jgi:hypothetical protein
MVYRNGISIYGKRTTLYQKQTETLKKHIALCRERTALFQKQRERLKKHIALCRERTALGQKQRSTCERELKLSLNSQRFRITLITPLSCHCDVGSNLGVGGEDKSKACSDR